MVSDVVVLADDPVVLDDVVVLPLDVDDSEVAEVVEDEVVVGLVAIEVDVGEASEVFIAELVVALDDEAEVTLALPAREEVEVVNDELVVLAEAVSDDFIPP